MWTVIELLKETREFFARKGIDSSRLDAELLLALCLGKSRVQLYLDFEQPVGDIELSAYREMVRRRAMHEPVAYIIGEKEFWSLPFTVNRSVLIPRPETEILVQETVSILGRMDGTPQVLEIGVGSGAVCIALAKENDTIAVSGTDISPEALAVACHNAARHRVADRICFIQAEGLSWCRQYPFFDVIVSNPPYISSGSLAGLAPEIRLFEPRVALNGGRDGLRFYVTCIDQIGKAIKRGGWVVLEIGQGQGPDVTGIISAAGCFHNIRTVEDYARCDRVVVAQKR